MTRVATLPDNEEPSARNQPHPVIHIDLTETLGQTLHREHLLLGFGIFVSCAIGAIGIGSMMKVYYPGYATLRVILMVLALILPFLVGFGSAILNQRQNRRRELRRIRTVTDASKKLHDMIVIAPRRPARLPTATSVLIVLRDSELGMTGAIVVTDNVDWRSEANEYTFEPVVYSPVQRTSSVKSALTQAATFAVIAILFMLAGAPKSSAVMMPGMNALCALTPIVIIVGVTLIRPRYLRIAPGRIQTLEYALWRKVPTIRDYPLTAGTAVVYGRGQEKAIKLARDGYADRFSLSMENDEEFSDLLRRAIFATVRTPEMSKTELFG